MKLTAMDITSKEFKKVIRGYDTEEVEEFLDKIAEDYEVLFKENSTLKDKILVMNEKLDHYAKMETTIQNTLLLAQNTAEQARQTAQKEAEMIVNSANESAQRILDKAHQDVIKVNDDYEKLKHEFNKFRSQYKIFMKTQIDTFESVERDFFKNYNLGKTVEDNLKEKELDFTEIKEREFKIKDVNDEEFKDNSFNEIKNFFVKAD